MRELYKKEGGKFPDPILNAWLPYTDPYNPSLAEVAKEINGKALADITDPKTNQTIKAGQQLPGFAWLKDDGTTFCGNWLYCGSWTEAGAMIATSRDRRSFRPGHLSQLGVVVAGEPPRAVQPRLVRSGRQAWDPRGGRFGGTKASNHGSATTCPTSRRTPSRKITWARSS